MKKQIHTLAQFYLKKKIYIYIVYVYTVYSRLSRVSFRGRVENDLPPPPRKMGSESELTNYLKIVQFCIMNHN